MRRDSVTWNSIEGKRSLQLMVNEFGQSVGERVSFGTLDTFISHKGNDTWLAEMVGDTLHGERVTAYLDKWDPEVDGDSPGLEIHIREVIRETPSIVAVVTANTPLSWWVPFEIGVARETNSQIATFLWINEWSTETVLLPSYLRKWPILASWQELRVWAQGFARSRSDSIKLRRVKLEHAVRVSADWRGNLTIDMLVQSGKVRFEG